jgi:hypothetical protein
MLSIGWKKRYENKALAKFQLIVTLDKIIYINSNISIIVTQPQLTKKNWFTFGGRSLIKIGHIDRLGVDVYVWCGQLCSPSLPFCVDRGADWLLHT